MNFKVIITDFEGNRIATGKFKQIADAMTMAKSIGFRADVIDNKTGELLWVRFDNEVTYSIFTALM